MSVKTTGLPATFAPSERTIRESVPRFDPLIHHKADAIPLASVRSGEAEL